MTLPRVDKLAIEHPILNQPKMNMRLGQIKKMSDFYRTRSEVVEPGQARAFLSYVAVLAYCFTIIKLYDELTQKLHEEELADEAGPDSES